jgi:hypothetical protein
LRSTTTPSRSPTSRDARDPRDRRLEVYRRPATDPAAEFGWRYLDVDLVAPGAAVAPLALPEVRTAVADLLP